MQDIISAILIVGFAAVIDLLLFSFTLKTNSIVNVDIIQFQIIKEIF